MKRAVYVAIGINLDGKKDVLGMWIGENESARYWTVVLNSLKNRGVEDILIACTDNLTGFSQAIEAVFPKTDIQNCIIHQLRNSSKYVSYKDIRNAAVYSRSGKAAVRRQKRKTPGEAGETGLQDETTESRVMHSSGLDQKGLIDESIERSYEEFRAGEQQKKDDDNKES